MINKRNITATLAIAAIIASCSVNRSKQNTEANEGEKQQIETTKHVLKREIPVITSFTHLTNIGGIDIEYEQGDYKIVAEGDSSLIQHVTTTFDSNLLTVTMPYDSNEDINVYYASGCKVKLYITAPDLQCVSLCGNGSFHQHGVWKQDDISLGHLSSSTFSVDTIECTSFKMENSGSGTLSFNHIAGRNVIFFTRGSKGSLTADVDADTLSISNIGQETLTYSGRYGKKYIDKPTSDKLNDYTLSK